MKQNTVHYVRTKRYETTDGSGHLLNSKNDRRTGTQKTIYHEISESKLLLVERIQTTSTKTDTNIHQDVDQRPANIASILEYMPSLI
jgi:hypothetical protein